MLNTAQIISVGFSQKDSILNEHFAHETNLTEFGDNPGVLCPLLAYGEQIAGLIWPNKYRTNSTEPFAGL